MVFLIILILYTSLLAFLSKYTRRGEPGSEDYRLEVGTVGAGRVHLPESGAKVKVRRDEYFKARDAKRADKKSAGGGGSNGGGGVPERDPKDDSATTPRQPKTFRIQGKGDEKRVQWKCDECERWCDHPTDLHARAAKLGDGILETTR